MTPRHPIVVGILGAAASGKSAVARLLVESGGELIDADRIGHQALERPEVIRNLRQEFGSGILAADGTADRRKLRDFVFGDPERLERLGCMVHPIIIETIDRRIREARERPDVPLIVLDAPLLLEKNLHRRYCDVLVYVEADFEARRQRAFRDRGWSVEQLAQCDAAQIPPETKRRLADFVVQNDGTHEQLRKAVRALVEGIRQKWSGISIQAPAHN